MNTKNSDEIVARFRELALPGTRKRAVWSHVVSGTPEEVFPLLCPSREADWIPGWTAELIHSESGYAERDCVFRTGADDGSGPAVWVFTRHEEPVLVEIARFTPDLLTQIRACLEEHDAPDEGGAAGVRGPRGGSNPMDETQTRRTTVRWEYVMTGLTWAGRSMMDRMDPKLEHRAKSLGLALDHYLRTGEMIKAG